jgi:hypothetical protein
MGRMIVGVDPHKRSVTLEVVEEIWFVFGLGNLC